MCDCPLRPVLSGCCLRSIHRYTDDISCYTGCLPLYLGHSMLSPTGGAIRNGCSAKGEVGWFVLKLLLVPAPLLAAWPQELPSGPLRHLASEEHGDPCIPENHCVQTQLCHGVGKATLSLSSGPWRFSAHTDPGEQWLLSPGRRPQRLPLVWALPGYCQWEVTGPSIFSQGKTGA